MRAWKLRKEIADLVESGWEQAPGPVRAAAGLAESLSSGLHDLLERSRPAPCIEVPGSTRIVSVGATSWGGDGKTALASHIASELSTRGLCVSVVSRSYGARARGPSRVPGGPLLDRVQDANRWGDEAVMLAALNREVSVWSGPDRLEALRLALASNPDAVVIDDGLGLEIRKDVEIALLSAGQASFRRIPAGPMRRPVEHTARAHVVGIRDTASGNGFEAEANRLLDAVGATGRPWFGFRLEPTGPQRPERVWLASGIARPGGFEEAALGAGYTPVGHTWYPDHHVPDSRDLDDLASEGVTAGARAILITAKDAPRFPARVGGLSVMVLQSRLVPSFNGEVLAGSVEAIAGKE